MWKDLPLRAKQEQLAEWRDSFLCELECLLGPRDPKFSLGEIAPRGSPVAWADKYNIIQINLSRGEGGEFCDNEEVIKWQLAHECVHCLDPYSVKEGKHTIVLEEGIATWFQNQKVKNIYPEGQYKNAYIRAETLVSKWMEDKYLPSAIRSIRKEGTHIRDITKEKLREKAPYINNEPAKELTQIFESWKKLFITVQ